MPFFRAGYPVASFNAKVALAAQDESVVVFRDLQHVTATFATAMAQQIRTKLSERGIVASE